MNVNIEHNAHNERNAHNMRTAHIVRWTTEQERSITLRGKNMLVAAGAGSGKTAVLTERIVSLVLEGTRLSSMLVVTFTNAAAAEMKRRIQQQLTKLCADPLLTAQARAHTREQLSSMGKANISTLHAFCVQILRRHFQEAEVDPAFRVGDEVENSILRAEALEEIIDEAYEQELQSEGSEENRGSFRALCDGLGKDGRALSELILKIYHFIFAQSEPWKWLDEAIAQYAFDEQGIKESRAYKELYDTAARGTKQAAELVKKARRLLPADNSFDKARALLDGEAMTLRGFAVRMKDGFVTIQALCALKFETLRFPKSDCDTEPVKLLRNKAKELICQIKEQQAYYSPAEQAKLLLMMRPQVEALAALVRAFHGRYAEKKAQRGIIDFADIEHGALAALNNESIAAEYRKRFEHVFIDEYQDSNAVQEALIDRIRRENNLFCVGDVKQSIYRFRLAEPSLFSDRQDAYAAECGGVLIALNENFRSSHNVLSCVNDLFSRIMNKEKGEIDYDDKAALRPGRAAQETTAAVVVDVIEKQADDEELEVLLDAEWEARQAARRIRERLGKPVWDLKSGVYRAAKYSDFALLLRTTKEVAHAFARVFAQEGIPAFAELTGGFFEAIEVQVLVNLLRLCDNRRQDVPLLSVLRSGIGDFTDDEIVEIRARAPLGTYFDAFSAAAKKEDEIGRKAAAFLAFLHEARRQSRIMRLQRFMEWLLDKTGYADAVGILEGGGQRSANVEAMLERACAYEAAAGRGLAGFLGYIDQLFEADTLGEARLSGEDGNCVRIMSIHKSKGLEFPIVLLAMTGRKFNLRDAYGDIALHRTLFLGCTAFDTTDRTKTGTLYKQAIAVATQKESIAEEMRVLYVAMTRAKEELYIIGSICETFKREQHFSDGEAVRPIDWILSAAMRFKTGGNLKEICGFQSGNEQHEGDWELNFIRRSELKASDAVLRSKLLKDWLQTAQHADPSYYNKRYAWQYPHTGAQVPSKLAASRLGGGERRIELSETPRFLATKAMTAADIGTALHAALYYLDLSGALDAKDISAQLAKAVERELMTAEQLKAVDTALLEGFFASELGKRMAAAKELCREQPFTFFKSARELLGVDSDEQIVVQGVIDAYFKDSGGCVLIDYKSDRITDASLEGLRQTAQTHRPQMELYAEALERLLGCKVSEKHIFLLRAGQAVRL